MIRQPARRLLLSAGEPSGDLMGAELIAELRSRGRGFECEGVGGGRMVAAGLVPLARAESLATLGFLEAVAAVPRHLALYRRLVKGSRAGRYAGAVLIDYPGFHLRLGRALRRTGIPVVQYVAPQLWAWRAGRLSRLREAADEVAAVLPFEEQWFGERGLPCHYVGHPACDRTWPSCAAARGRLGITSPEPVLGMFPGSRAGEIERHWPLFREVAFRLLAAGHCRQVIVAGTPAGRYPDPGPCQVHHGAPELVQAAATVLLTKSGSATLEAAIVGTPMVVVYRTSRLTYEIARRQMTVNRISLVNLIAGQDVVPEFWHPPVSAAPIAAAVRPLLDSASVEATRQRAALEQVRHRLGGRGTAVRVADLLLGRLEC